MIKKGERFDDQNRLIAAETHHFLDLFDKEFAEDEIPLPKRPLLATKMLCKKGAIELRYGNEIVDISRPSEQIGKEWFRAFYAGVEHWYVQRYGAAKIMQVQSEILQGIVLIYGAAFAISVPAQRRKVEIEGETAWIFFEDCVIEDENPLEWVLNGPNLTKCHASINENIASTAREVTKMLRFIRFRSGFLDTAGNEDVRNLCETGWNYLQHAAHRIVNGGTIEKGLAWFDLQMANELFLKAVTCRATGKYKRVHALLDLVDDAEKHGLIVEPTLLSGWPDFGIISERRYGQCVPGGLKSLFSAYITSLRLVSSCMEAISPTIQPGFGILLRYAPWKYGSDGAAGTSSAEAL